MTLESAPMNAVSSRPSIATAFVPRPECARRRDADLLFQHTWLDPGPASLPAGVRWDAVRVTEALGKAALAHLRRFGLASRIGAVLAHGHSWWFIIRPDADPAPWPPNSKYLSTGSFLAIPNPAREHAPNHGSGLRWIKAPSGEAAEVFTDEPTLRTVLEVLNGLAPLPELSP